VAIGGVVGKLAHASTGVIKVYSMQKKDATLTLLQMYNTNVMPIAELPADNEAVFRSTAVKDLCAASGIRNEPECCASSTTHSTKLLMLLTVLNNIMKHP
jgi:hypothetical protein